MTQRESGVEQAARVLPLRLRSGVMSLPEDRRSQIRSCGCGWGSLWRQCCRRGRGHWPGPP